MRVAWRGPGKSRAGHYDSVDSDRGGQMPTLVQFDFPVQGPWGEEMAVNEPLTAITRGPLGA